MSDLQDFKNPKYLRHIEPGELLPIGSFMAPYDFKLVGFSVMFQIFGAIAGTERFAIEIYSTKKRDNLLWTSEDFTVPVDLKTGDHWLGWFKFEFNRKQISTNFRYFVFLRQRSYAPTTGYMALVFDYHDSQYPNGENKFYNHPMAFRVEGEVEHG